jgi:hypothetical protein
MFSPLNDIDGAGIEDDCDASAGGSGCPWASDSCAKFVPELTGVTGSPFVIVACDAIGRLKIAVQFRAADIVTLPFSQPTPTQVPNTEPVAGVAVRTTTCAAGNAAAHVGPQLIPAGLLVIVPPPAPALFTVSVLGAVEENVAVQLCPTDMVTLPSVQSASPVHPAKMDPAFGVAVKSTTCPAVNASLQSVPQSMPAGLLVTVPLPFPVLPIDKDFVTPGIASNTLMLLLPAFAVAKSALPSPLKSPTMTEYGPLPAPVE